MSTFLGNHDVARFIAQASGEIGSLYGDSACGGDGNLRTPDVAPEWDEPYRRLMLGWTFLLTSEGLPLVYYGDEIGLPGYNDPDNRQRMRFDDELAPNERWVREHVATLGRARQEHPAFSSGTRTAWWEGESDVLAYARVSGDDGVLVAINRGDQARALVNGLGFAGLPPGAYRDVLSDEVFVSDGDRLSLTVPALGSRVLVKEGSP
jgi:glycosidase